LNDLNGLDDVALARVLAAGAGDLLIALRNERNERNERNDRKEIDRAAGDANNRATGDTSNRTAIDEANRTASDAQNRALGDAGDRQANDFLLHELRAARPLDAILSEESIDDFARLHAQRIWIIDPLDGTREYREGRDDWAVHIALVEQGAVTAASVALPAMGATFDSSPLQVITSAPARRVVISRSRPPAFAAQIARAIDAELMQVGSAGAKAMMVVRGEALAYVHEGGLNEWDAAAPAGVALAHGLAVCDLKGNAITFNHHDVVLRKGFIVCRPELLDAILRCI
jgi:3'(2'), 5'-bisphosphate nucleotidase